MFYFNHLRYSSLNHEWFYGDIESFFVWRLSMRERWFTNHTRRNEATRVVGKEALRIDSKNKNYISSSYIHIRPTGMCYTYVWYCFYEFLLVWKMKILHFVPLLMKKCTHFTTNLAPRWYTLEFHSFTYNILCYIIIAAKLVIKFCFVK